MFEIIKGVDIGQGAGNAFGGGIFAASCDIGFSNGPTKITLNVVSESGIYQSVALNVYSTPYNIDLNGKIFSGMYLYAYEQTKSAGSALMTVKFLDSSLLLDKIYIGLLNRHGNLYRETNIRTGDFTVRCPSCYDGLMVSVSGAVRRYLDSVPKGHYFEKGEDNAGYIILGKEYFPESNCIIPRVDYNFTELCQALTDFSIKHDLARFDLNPLYRQEYVGTLREVLNNWASDFSFEFFYDGDTLKGIDLRKPVNIDGVIQFAETSSYVTNYTYGETLENTYTQSFIARYLKPTTAIDYNSTYHYKVMADQIHLNDILVNGQCAGRNIADVAISVGLKRIDPSLREAYIANIAVERNDVNILKALGFREFDGALPYPMLGAHKSMVIKQSSFYLNQESKDPSIQATCDVNNYAVFVGIFEESVKQDVEAWDEAAADFLGSYYSFQSDLPFNRFDCPVASDWFTYYTMNSQWSTSPNSQVYGGDAVPFARILRDPVSKTPFISSMTRNIFKCDDNCWGIEQSSYDEAKGVKDYDMIRPQIIPCDENPVDGDMTWQMLQAYAMSTIPSDVMNAIKQDSQEQKAVVAFLVVPLLSKLSTAPKISPMAGNIINPLVYQRLISRTNNDDAAAKCSTFCDANIVSELCNCGSNYTPVPYFSQLFAPYFQVFHPNGNVSNIIFPVDATYFGYFTQGRYYKTTNPPVKKIYGTPPSQASNTLATRIIDYDITPDLDAVMDQNDAINLYIYSPTNNLIMTAQAYYDELANLNNLSVSSQKTLSMTLAKTNVASLGLPVSPESGLIGMNISLSDGGIETQMNYATRPPVIPNQEAVFSKIQFRMRGKN